LNISDATGKKGRCHDSWHREKVLRPIIVLTNGNKGRKGERERVAHGGGGEGGGVGGGWFLGGGGGGLHIERKKKEGKEGANTPGGISLNHTTKREGRGRFLPAVNAGGKRERKNSHPLSERKRGGVSTLFWFARGGCRCIAVGGEGGEMRSH